MHAIYNKTLSYKLYEFTANYCRSQYAPVIATNTDVTMWVKKDNYAYLWKNDCKLRMIWLLTRRHSLFVILYKAMYGLFVAKIFLFNFLSFAWNFLLSVFAWNFLHGKIFMFFFLPHKSFQYIYDTQSSCMLTNQTLDGRERNKSFQGKLSCYFSVHTVKAVLGELVWARTRHELDKRRT